MDKRMLRVAGWLILAAIALAWLLLTSCTADECRIAKQMGLDKKDPKAYQERCGRRCD